METSFNNLDKIIIETYQKMRMQVFFFIKKIAGCGSDADIEDLTQDTFLHLLKYRQWVNNETIRSFVFTIARNIAIDYLRRHYKKKEIDTYLYMNTSNSINDMEEQLIANDLAKHEKLKLSLLAPQRRTIYALSRFEEKTIDEIADTMCLSRRTIENHLRLGRNEIRVFMKECI